MEMAGVAITVEVAGIALPSDWRQAGTPSNVQVDDEAYRRSILIDTSSSAPLPRTVTMCNSLLSLRCDHAAIGGSRCWLCHAQSMLLLD